MKAEIITIGDEILIGQTVDTNSAWIGSALSLAGFDIIRKTTIHDKRQDILKALGDVTPGTNVVITTGGLGPTSDDITKQTLCEFFGTKLVLNNEVLRMIETMMSRRKIPLNANILKQAEVPDSARVLTNEAGTAPGLWFEKAGTVFISLPGVPYEMKFIMDKHVLADLKKRFISQVIYHKNVMTYGVPESRLAELLADFEAGLPENIRLAYLPSYGIIKLRLTGSGRNEAEIKSLMDNQIMKLRSIIPGLIYSEGEESLEKTIGRLLTEQKRSVCTAESCTGGNIAHMITSIAGSSAYFKGSVIAYENSVKTQLLGVDRKTIESDGAVSEPVVKAMSEEARKLLDTDFSVATSGIAGPGGGTEEKPVGTLWVAVSSESVTVAEKYTFGNDRSTNIQRFSNAALNLLRKQIIRK